MSRIVFILILVLFYRNTYAQEGILTFGVQYKPIFSSRFFGAGPVGGEVEYLSVERTPRLGHSFGMSIRRGFTKMFSYETGINYVRRNYFINCIDSQSGKEAKFDFGLVGYEIPNQFLVYIRLGENLFMNTATGISMNWFASDVASSSSDVKFFQKTYIKPGWIKFALIANIGFELRTEKNGIYYLGASLTNPFKDIATTTVTYDETLSTPDKEIPLGLRGGIFTIDLRYFFKSDPIKKKSKRQGKMKVSGFTIIRNAIKYDYPIVESIQSILPVCDEVIVAVGNSEDETRKLIQSINSPKIKIIDTVWDDTLREGGRVLANETDKAFKAISKEADWCFYIQGDEVLHEKFHQPLLESMLKWKDDVQVEGLLFDYEHFYGSYDYLGDSRGWYQKEIRIVRNDSSIYSFRDAQGFQKNGRPLNVKTSGGSIYHYGWVKHPQFQQQKQLSFNKLWHDDQWMEKNIEKVDEFDYSQVESLKLFTGTHPVVMKNRIEKMNWKFSFDPTQKKLSVKNKFHRFLKKYFGISIGVYRNYRILK